MKRETWHLRYALKHINSIQQPFTLAFSGFYDLRDIHIVVCEHFKKTANRKGFVDELWCSSGESHFDLSDVFTSCVQVHYVKGEDLSPAL